MPSWTFEALLSQAAALIQDLSRILEAQAAIEGARKELLKICEDLDRAELK